MQLTLRNFYRHLANVPRNSALLRTAMGSMLLKVMASAFGLLNGILLARKLGPAEYGVYSLLMAAITFASTLAALGLPSLITRQIALYQAKSEWGLLKGLVSFSAYWAFLASIGVMLLSALIVIVLGDEIKIMPMGWMVALSLIPIMTINQLRAAILRGLHWVIAADIPDLMLRPIVVTGMIAAAYVISPQLDSNGAVVIQAFALLTSLIVGWCLLRRFKPAEFDIAEAVYSKREWLQGASVFLLISFIGILESQLPLYMLGYLTNSKQVGLYNAAVQIVSIVVMGLVAVNMSLQPRLAASWGKGECTESQRLLTEAAKIGTVIAIGSALVLLPFAERILHIYGGEFIDAAWSLRILVLGQVVNAMSGSCGVVLAMTGHQRLVLIGGIIALICNAAIGIWLIPRYGNLGAASASAASLLIWNLLFIYLANRKLKLLTYFKW